MKIGKSCNIDFSSFFHKAPPKIKDEFLVCLINGYMGSGKTYLAVYFASKYIINLKIKTNIKSLKIPNRDTEYFDRISDIVYDTEEYVLYVIDELGKKYPKECRMDKDFYNFLQHSRKCKRYVLLIHQEYLQVPTWIRGVVSVVYTTNKLKLFPIYKTIKGYPYLDEESKEWNVKPISTYYYKRNIQYSQYYDTFEKVFLE